MINLRKPTSEDIDRFIECLAAEPDHKGQDPTTWISEPGELWTFYDEQGNRIWVRLERVLRVHLQHDQQVKERHLVRLFFKAFSWLQGAARNASFAEVIFESTVDPLIQFFCKRFGFTATEHNYSIRLDNSCAGRVTPKTN